MIQYISPRRTTLAAIMVVPAAFIVSAQLNAAEAVRFSIDSVVNESQTDGPAVGYYEDIFTTPTPTPDATLVGATGSLSGNGSRYMQDLIHRYTLPELEAGQTLESFTFSFTVTAFRDQDQSNQELDVYLLDSADPTTTGTDLYFRGATGTDPNNELLGSHYNDDVGDTRNSITLDPAQTVTFTINSGSALTLMQSFYGGDHIPDTVVASFRFNMDQPDVGITGDALSRYYVDSDLSTSSLALNAIPEPGSFALIAGLIGLCCGASRRRR
jgi:hypothetical protein